MKKASPLLAYCSLFVFAIGASAQELDLIDLLVPENRTHDIVERGRDYAVFQRITESTNWQGESVRETNEFVLLENGLHYVENGEWRVSEDLIEPFPDGAVARRGPWRTIFSPELAAETVFDIETPEGGRIRGGVRAIQLTDMESGRSIVLGRVKEGVRGEIIPPNNVVYRDGFEGIDADVLFVWRHNEISQNVILKRRPELPPGMNPRTARLEVVSEFVEMPEPEVGFETIREEGRPDLRDDARISAGSMTAIRGRAFPISDARALMLTGQELRDGTGLPVVKQLFDVAERRFVIESVGWEEIQPMLDDLPVMDEGADFPETDGRTWPEPLAALVEKEPLLLAVGAYQNNGFLVDLDLSGTSTGYVFSGGTTYYIANSFTIASCPTGSSADFRAGTVIKFASNAYLRNSCWVDSPVYDFSYVFFTSKDDDTIGSVIAGSSHVPTYAAEPAFQLYYMNTGTSVNRFWIRHAKRGIQVLGSSAVTHNINSSYFQDCDIGIDKYGFSGTPNLSNLKYCSVVTPLTGGTFSGTMEPDCIGIENSWTGDSGWELGANAATAGWPGYSGGEPQIEGFADKTSVNVGSSISLYVDVRNGETSHKIEIYRMGWYDGLGGRKMTWYDSASNSSITQKIRTGNFLQSTPTADSNGSIDCLAGATPWTNAYTFTVPSEWVSGVFLAKLTTLPSGKCSYIIFTVREDNRSSDLYFQNSVTTWQAYNPWGGRSLYPYPPGTANATQVSFNRPYAGATVAWNGVAGGLPALQYGNGAGEFFTMINADAHPAWEYNALRWIEKVGLDVTYCTSVDTETGWPAGKTTKAFLSVGHDEYWSLNMRNNVKAKRDSGVNLAFMGANACFYKIGFSGGFRSFTCTKSGSDFWRNNEHEATLIGVEYVDNSYDLDMSLTNPNPSHWAFYLTGVSAGGTFTLPGLLGYEVDGCWVGDPCNLKSRDSLNRDAFCPESVYPNVVKLAASQFFSCNPGADPNIPGGGVGWSYMTMYSAPLGGSNVWASGSMFWNWGLDDFGYSTCMPIKPPNTTRARVKSQAQQMTWNVLRTFSGKPQSAVP